MKLTPVDHDPFRNDALDLARRLRAAGGRIAPANIDHNPTEAQKEAGNYAKDHVKVHGLDISIENAKGKPRRGIGKNGKPWSVIMPAHYGYFKRTEGADGDHVDCYVGPDTNSKRVFVVDQVDDRKHQFDEHKCMLGFSSKAQAVETYKKGFSDGKGDGRLGNITEMDMDEFKRWLDKGTHRPANHAKAEKASVDYSIGKPHAHCGICRHYHDHLCTLVKGHIEPHMWCELFEKMARASGGRVGFADGGSPMLQRTGPFPEKPEGYEFYAPTGGETTETGGVAPGVGSPGPIDISQIPGVGAEGVAPLVSAPPESTEQRGIFAPSKYPMEPSLMDVQLGHQELPEGVGINEQGFLYDKATGADIPSIPRPGLLPLTKDPSGKPELAMPKILDIASNIVGGPVPGVAGPVLGSGVARGVKAAEELPRPIPETPVRVPPYEGPKAPAAPTPDFSPDAFSRPGGIGRDTGLAEAQGQAEAAAGPVRPLEGLPQKPVILGDEYYVPGPLERVHRVAEEYMQSAGLPYEPVREYVPVSIPRARRIAKAFDEMKHDPADPQVKAAYDAMINETVAQFHALQRDGIKIEFIKPGQRDPYYASPRLAAKDVRDNNHLWVFPTDLGFGTEHLITDNPLLAKTGIVVDGRELLANDAFRIVHDYFGHLKDGVGFRAAGEENAWRSHSRMYTPLARQAMTTETRGQNSWLNYGPHGEKNRTAKSDETVFADQKIGILPEWAVNEGAADPFVRGRNEAGVPIRNAGLSGPTHPAQTVADPHRMMFPGIYESPRRIASEAAKLVVPEDPAMKLLWGVDREDIYQAAKGRIGNEEPNVKLAKNPRGSLAAQNIQTPRNTQRLIDILTEAAKHEGLRHSTAWYYSDPIYRRMVDLVGPDEAVDAYKKFNTLVGMMSPSSDVVTELRRGTAGHAMYKQGRYEDFVKYGGVKEAYRGADYPKLMQGMPSHPYHGTSQAPPAQKWLETGEFSSPQPKVRTYIHASGVPETGFQTSGPVGDSHFSRGVGLSDTRKGPTDVESSLQPAEYQTLQPWWQHEVAGEVGLESVPAQAQLWTTLGPRTGVESGLGQSKLEILSGLIMKYAKARGIPPDVARDKVLMGQAGATFYARAGIPLGLYSAVERAVDAINQTKASPQQWINTIRNSPGVKPEELKWMGLEDWLKEQKGPVTKEQVSDYVRANNIRVAEVTKGAENLTVRPSADHEGEFNVVDDSGRVRFSSLTEDEANQYIREEHETGGRFPTKFSTYTLPGGENYRELLLTLPGKERDVVQHPDPWVRANLQNDNFVKDWIRDHRHLDKYARIEEETRAEHEARLEKIAQNVLEEASSPQYFRKTSTQEEPFVSSHFDEPNIVAHVRFNDRTIDGKKTLFLEEVQSDWHQAGREKGYKSSEPPLTEKEKFDIAYRSRNMTFEEAIDRGLVTADDVRRYQYIPGRGGVPDAPFKTTWPELAMKRMIRYAAENGYDKVAWTPGEVQASRYDLSAHIDKLHYNPDTQELYAIKDGKPIITRDQVERRDLAGIVGKDVAERLLATKLERNNDVGRSHTLSGLDLKIGGEGMKGFYDQMLPSMVNKLVKKFGARVGQEKITTADTKVDAGHYIRDDNGEWHPPTKVQSVHALDITPQMRNAVMEQGFPQFSSGGSVKPRLTPVAHDPFEVHKAIGRAINGHKPTRQ